MNQVTYKDFNFNLKNNKFYLNEILKFFKYEIIEKEILVTKDYLIIYLNEDKKEELEFIKFLKNDFIEPLMDIFSFIEFNKYNININEFFNELWYSFKNKKEILITPNLLNFMYNLEKENIFSCNDFKNKKKEFLDFLKENNIEFKEIDYNNKNCNNHEYILNDIKINNKNLHSEKYIFLTIKNFKKVVMIKSNIVRDYYLNFEEIFYAYEDYEKEYEKKINKLNYKKEVLNIEKNKDEEIKKLKEDLISLEEEKDDKIDSLEKDIEYIENEYSKKLINLENDLTDDIGKLEQENHELKIDLENEIERLEEENKDYKKQNLFFKEKLIEINILKKEEIIYIYTSKSYAEENKFKIGGVENINLLKYKLNKDFEEYEDEEWYYTIILKVNNYKSFENRFWSIMNNFRDKNDKETIIMLYSDLEKIFKNIKNNYDNDIEYFNSNIKEILNNITEDNFIPEAYKIQ